MLFGKKSKEELKREDRAVSDLIDEQRLKENIEVWRRGWCISEATCVLDDCDAAAVIRMAEEIYKYVYGERERGGA